MSLTKMPDLTGLVQHFPYLGLFVVLILGGVGLPFPEDATLILCGFLIAHGIVKPVPAFVVVYSGLLLADFSLYFIGKRYGRRVVTHKRLKRFISPERLSKLEEKFKKRGTLVILFGRHVAGLRVQIFLIAGVLRMSPLKFITADALSSIATIALMVGIGYMGGQSLAVVRKDSSRVEHIAVLAGITFLILYLFVKYFKHKRNDTPFTL